MNKPVKIRFEVLAVGEAFFFGGYPMVKSTAHQATCHGAWWWFDGGTLVSPARPSALGALLEALNGN